MENKEETNELNEIKWTIGKDDDDSFINFLEYMEETIQNAKINRNSIALSDKANKNIL